MNIQFGRVGTLFVPTTVNAFTVIGGHKNHAHPTKLVEASRIISAKKDL